MALLSGSRLGSYEIEALFDRFRPQGGDVWMMENLE
jgi:hypothetical protein